MNAVNTLKAYTSYPLSKILPKKRVTSNARNETQLKFHSTKKTSNEYYRRAKPTNLEELSCTIRLNEEEVVHCGYCFNEDDGDTADMVE